MTDPDKLQEAYIKGIEEGKKHSVPSPKTMELFENIEKQLHDKADKADIKGLTEKLSKVNENVLKKANKSELEAVIETRKSDLKWAVGIIISLVVMSAGFFWTQIESKAEKADIDLLRTDIRNLSDDIKHGIEKTQENSKDISQLTGQLKQLQLIE